MEKKTPFLIKMRDNRANRALETYEKTLKIWNKLNKFMKEK